VPKNPKQHVALTLLVAISTAVVYRYLLVTRAFQPFSLAKWRLIAILFALAMGLAFARLRLSVLTLLLASVIGLLAGGTWAVRTSPSDIPVSMLYAFESQLQLFWRETAIWIAAVAVGATIASLYLGRRFPGSRR
jgi:hypothetical protein